MAKEHAGPLGTLGDVQVEAVVYHGYPFIRIMIYSGTKPDEVSGQFLLDPRGAVTLRDDLTKALEISKTAQVESAIVKTLRRAEVEG